ncbi:hypothetical protein DPMN_046850 [Dreissena polymorpha]|uniref:Uncharacterized protein n=1 Tax=Dreissena polymorpha TaxID=45954 RepID=A0A9D4HYK7_DREPO|nr:hypothetical protein DPMN_046850 [Dreissena polymorpha]
MSCSRGRGVFVMDPLTGCVTMTKEWDLDAANKRLGEETVVCTVTANGRRGLTTTAKVSLRTVTATDRRGLETSTTVSLCTVTATDRRGLETTATVSLCTVTAIDRRGLETTATVSLP